MEIGFERVARFCLWHVWAEYENDFFVNKLLTVGKWRCKERIKGEKKLSKKEI